MWDLSGLYWSISRRLMIITGEGWGSGQKRSEGPSSEVGCALGVDPTPAGRPQGRGASVKFPVADPAADQCKVSDRQASALKPTLPFEDYKPKRKSEQFPE